MFKSAKKVNAKPINEPLTLWRKLQSDAGLELWRGKSPGRDADFEKAIFDHLVALLPERTEQSGETVTQLLKRGAKLVPSAFSVEHLLSAIVDSQRGFGAMLRAILDTLERAKATQCTNSLSIRIPTGAGGLNGMLFDQFREYVEKIERVLQIRLEPIGYGLMQDVRGLLEQALRCDTDRLALDDVEARAQVDWEPPPRQVSTGNVTVDSILSLILEVVTTLRTWASTTTPHRSNLRVHQFSEGDRDRAGMLANFGDCYIVELVHALARQVRDGKIDAQHVVAALVWFVNAVPRREEWVDKTIKELTDLLNLPAWRQRYELYSVWLGTILLETARNRADSFEYQTVDNVLSFDFGGSRLATYEFGGSSYEIWAELRSGLVGTSTVRTSGIQPDFRVVSLPETGDRNVDTRFVVESKHYLVASATNFICAANDYARSCANAHVAVVNHGVGDPTELSKGLETGNFGRVTFFEQVSVDIDRGAALSSKIAEVLFPIPKHSDDTLAKKLRDIPFDTSKNVAQIAISWTSPLHDVDLSVRGRDASQRPYKIDFQEMGWLEGQPYVRLQRDCMNAPGDEVIEVSKWHLTSYEIRVNNYSELGTLSDESVCCSIVFEDHSVVALPAKPIVGTWVVGTIHFFGGTPQLSLSSDSKLDLSEYERLQNPVHLRI